jgi:hypothetical protein
MKTYQGDILWRGEAINTLEREELYEVIAELIQRQDELYKEKEHERQIFTQRRSLPVRLLGKVAFGAGRLVRWANCKEK